MIITRKRNSQVQDVYASFDIRNRLILHVEFQTSSVHFLNIFNAQAAVFRVQAEANFKNCHIWE